MVFSYVSMRDWQKDNIKREYLMLQHQYFGWQGELLNDALSNCNVATNFFL
jgi:hypothetical protein